MSILPNIVAEISEMTSWIVNGGCDGPESDWINLNPYSSVNPTQYKWGPSLRGRQRYNTSYATWHLGTKQHVSGPTPVSGDKMLYSAAATGGQPTWRIGKYTNTVAAHFISTPSTRFWYQLKFSVDIEAQKAQITCYDDASDVDVSYPAALASNGIWQTYERIAEFNDHEDPGDLVDPTYETIDVRSGDSSPGAGDPKYCYFDSFFMRIQGWGPVYAQPVIAHSNIVMPIRGHCYNPADLIGDKPDPPGHEYQT